MQFRIKTLLIPVGLVLVGSGLAGGKHSWLMAQNQDLTQAQIDERCESIRRVLMGNDGTGKNGGLRYERAQAEAKAAQLQKDWDAAQQQTISLTMIDKYMSDDLRTIKGPWAVAPPDSQTVALARRDLDYWTAQKEKRQGGLGLQGTGLQVIHSMEKYPPFLQQSLTQEQQRLRELKSMIANENDVADSLNCQAYWASHQVNAPAAPSASGTGPGGDTVRVKVITTLSCAAADASGSGLGSVTVEFHKQKPAGTPDRSSAPLIATTGGDGTTAASGPLKISPGSYVVTVGPEFGNLAWVNLHIVQNSGSVGDRFNYDAKMGGVSVTFIPISSPKLAEEYQLALRLTSPQACTQ